MSDNQKSKNFERLLSDEVYLFNDSIDKSLALLDFLQAFNRLPNYFKRAFNELKLKYSRSVFGPLWETATVIAFVLGFAVIGGMIFGGDRMQYVAYLTAGIVFWQFISINIMESSGAFIKNISEIQTRKTSYSGLLVIQLLRNIFVLLHNIPLLFLVIIYTGNLNINILLFIPGMFLFLVFLLPFGLLVAMASTRFRDMQYATSTVMQFMFYMTPIFWPADSISTYPERLILDLNPFYHMLDILRGPFMGDPFNAWSFGILLGITIITYILAGIAFVRFRKRLVYWL